MGDRDQRPPGTRQVNRIDDFQPESQIITELEPLPVGRKSTSSAGLLDDKFTESRFEAKLEREDALRHWLRACVVMSGIFLFLWLLFSAVNHYFKIW